MALGDRSMASRVEDVGTGVAIKGSRQGWMEKEER